ncbi:hypothetical protein [Curvibacter phage PCA1]|nr:hypothetical protein [Curvibacter phage PCA1]
MRYQGANTKGLIMKLSTSLAIYHALRAIGYKPARAWVKAFN